MLSGLVGISKSNPPSVDQKLTGDAAPSNSACEQVLEVVSNSMTSKDQSVDACQMSWYGLEAQCLEGANSRLVERYLTRSNWEFNPEVLQLVWSAAEQANNEGSTDQAKKLWQLIIDQGAKAPTLQQFARARLDPTRTETEQLWQ